MKPICLPHFMPICTMVIELYEFNKKKKKKKKKKNMDKMAKIVLAVTQA